MLQEVTESRQARDFIDLPKSIYQDDPKWICPLDDDIGAVFEPSINPFFKNGECQRWVFYQNNQPVGRIAAFYTREGITDDKEIVGGLGFFESPDDQTIADTLFEAGLHWLI